MFSNYLDPPSWEGRSVSHHQEQNHTECNDISVPVWCPGMMFCSRCLHLHLKPTQQQITLAYTYVQYNTLTYKRGEGQWCAVAWPGPALASQRPCCSNFISSPLPASLLPFSSLSSPLPSPPSLPSSSLTSPLPATKAPLKSSTCWHYINQIIIIIIIIKQPS